MFIFASGEHGTPGYRTFFKQSKKDIFPPEFSFWHIKPEKIVIQVPTSFSDSTKFRSKNPVKSVTVYDATGRHVVKVQ